MSLMRNSNKEKVDPSLINDARNQESGAKSPLIKKGTIAYEPIPFFSDEPAKPKNQPPKAPEKSVQVLKEHPQTPAQEGPAPPATHEELLARMKEEAQRLMTKARGEAEKLVAEAQTKAKKLIEESKLYCQTAEQNAKREGTDAGHKEGYGAGLAELTQIMEAARDTMRQAVQERDRLEKGAEKDLARLAIKIAERVIGSEVTLNHNVVLNMVKANLERVKEREHVVIHVNQEDLENVRMNKEVLLKFVPEVHSMEIQADPRVDRGGCIVETNLGTVDARVSTQLEAVLLAFTRLDETAQTEESGGEDGRQA